MTLTGNRIDGHCVPCVIILNPWDSQGFQVADNEGIYPTVRGCGGGGHQQGYLLQRGNADARNVRSNSRPPDTENK